jgi:hypothetical protein
MMIHSNNHERNTESKLRRDSSLDSSKSEFKFSTQRLDGFSFKQPRERQRAANTESKLRRGSSRFIQANPNSNSQPQTRLDGFIQTNTRGAAASQHRKQVASDDIPLIKQFEPHFNNYILIQNSHASYCLLSDQQHEGFAAADVCRGSSVFIRCRFRAFSHAFGHAFLYAFD